MGYSAFAVANSFLALAKKDGIEITPLKIQKLVYIAHGYHLALTRREEHPDGVPLVHDEAVEAWTFGPVFPSLYHEFKVFGKDPITRRAQDIKFLQIAGIFSTDIVTPEVNKDDAGICALLDRIWEIYRKFSGPQLSSLTHAEGTPWYETYREGETLRNTHISNKVICSYYAGKLNHSGGDRDK